MKYRVKQNPTIDSLNIPRHCEARSAVAIQTAVQFPQTPRQHERPFGLPRACGPRNDETVGRHGISSFALTKFSPLLIAPTKWGNFTRRVVSWLALAALPIIPALADIAQGPLENSISGVPSNLMFALSVEFPTGRERAYIDLNNYVSANRYIGYFDPEGCYTYTKFDDDVSLNNAIEVNTQNTQAGIAGTNMVSGRTGAVALGEYFYKIGKATDHQCGGTGHSIPHKSNLPCKSMG
jgi:hypothetical protein